MRESSDHRREVVVVAAALALAGLTALGLAGLGANGWVRLTGFGRTASAQPDRGVGGPAIPGETVLPGPTQMPGERPDRWMLPPDPLRRPVIEAEGTLEAIDGTEVVLGGEAGPGATVGTGMAVELAGDTTYYVEGRPTTFDQVPEGVPARVTYELEGERRVALRVEVLEGEPAEPLPPPVP